MTYKIPPKIALINSFAGYGRCSTTEALPIISAMGVQVCPVPTALFSNHTGFPSHYCMDLTAQMAEYLAQWERLGLVFDGIYCGFLGQKQQLPIVADFIKKQKEKGCRTILVDPVMGDHGRPYKTITPEHCEALRDLVLLADIITPNLTEACILTGTAYREQGWTKEALDTLAAALHAFGPNKIAVTGLRTEGTQDNSDCFINFVSEADQKTGSFLSSSLTAPVTGPSRHGTGDIFASILAADAVLQRNFSDSVTKAAAFIGTCIRVSEELRIPECEGVCFENFLSML